MRLIHTVYEPAGEGPHPTLIAMHGFGANALDLLGLAPYIADGRFMVICPQGPMEVPIGPTRGGSRCVASSRLCTRKSWRCPWATTL